MCQEDQHNNNNKGLCLWYCHHGTAIARVHPVQLMNTEQCQVAINLWTKL